MKLSGLRSFGFILVFTSILAGCNKSSQEKGRFYPTTLIAFLNSNLNEAIIQDGFSPPVASRIYAYVNLAAYEGYFYNSNERLKLGGVLNGFEPHYTKSDSEIDPEFVMFTAFSHTALELVYRDFIVEQKILAHRSFYQSSLKGKVFEASEELGKNIASEVLKYASGDLYKETRSYPLHKLSDIPGSWEPTPPYYGTPIEPYWGLIRPFLTVEKDSFSVGPNVPFDTLPSSDFYALNMEVYNMVNESGKDEMDVAMYWDGDPMPAKRIKRVALTKRQLNPVGHWLALTTILCETTHQDEASTVTTMLKASLATADAMIIGWKNKYDYDVIRPHTYINRYIDEHWNPILATPLFPEYPSGHSVLAGACSGVLMGVFGDTVAFVDSSQIRFGFEPRSFKSISEAADECAMSRIYGGVHYEPAVLTGIASGRKVAEYHSMHLQTTE